MVSCVALVVFEYPVDYNLDGDLNRFIPSDLVSIKEFFSFLGFFWIVNVLLSVTSQSRYAAGPSRSYCELVCLNDLGIAAAGTLY